MNEQTTGRHPVSVGHLVMGVALLGLVAVWALWQGDVVGNDDVRWLMPVPWVAAGLVGLVASAITGTRRHSVRQTGWAGAPDPTDPMTEPMTEQTTQHETEHETEEKP